MQFAPTLFQFAVEVIVIFYIHHGPSFLVFSGFVVANPYYYPSKAILSAGATGSSIILYSSLEQRDDV
jgi:hypothetical protein